MELTRTERLIIETAADLFDFEIGAARAATLTTLELTSAELVAADGGRPQLGDIMIGRGWLSQEQLEQVLDRVYGEVQDWSERLVTPKPTPVPRAPDPEDQDVQLAELVEQLTGLLDVLVANGSSGGTIIRRAAAALSEIDAPITERVAPGNTRVGAEDEDEDTRDFPAPQSHPAPALNDETPTLHVERGSSAGIDDEDSPTLHVERSALARQSPADVEETDSPTLHIQRPEVSEDDDDTVHLERRAISPDPSGVEFKWSQPKDDDTVHFERPKEGTVHIERSVITTGDTVIIEGTSPGSSSH